PRPPGSADTTTTTTRPSAFRSQTGPSLGGFIGVASTSSDRSLRLFNGRQRYNEWLYVAGQPRVVGAQSALPGIPTGGGTAPGDRPPNLPEPEAPELP